MQTECFVLLQTLLQGGGFMGQDAMDAYSHFLQTGKISDYLYYLDIQNRKKSLESLEEMGGQGAYCNRRDCSAAAGHG